MKITNEQNYDRTDDQFDAWLEDMSNWEPCPVDLFLDEEIDWTDTENTNTIP